MIKHSTAFYGAVTIIREHNSLAGEPQGLSLFNSMGMIQETYAMYTAKEYKKRVGLALAAWTVFNNEAVFGAALRYYKARGKDIQAEIINKLRGFSSDTDFLAKFRLKPC